MTREVREYWIEDLKIQGEYLTCPDCYSLRFSVEPVDYGYQLACWNCPTYIGIRVNNAQ